MQLKKLWQQSLIWLLAIWIIVALAIKPGWLIFGAGCLLWAVIVYLTAPGVFWFGTYLLNLSPFKSDDNLYKAIACRPLIPQPYLTAGINLAKKKQWDQAVVLLEQAAVHSGKKIPAHVQSVLSVAYRETGELDKAAALLREMAAAGVKTFYFYTNCATVSMKQGDYQAALTAAAKARSYNVNATEPVLITAKVHFLSGNFQAAKDDYEWVLPRLSWPVETFYWLGRAELELQLFQAAQGHLQKAVERIGEDPLLSDVPLEDAKQWLAKAESANSYQLPVNNDL